MINLPGYLYDTKDAVKYGGAARASGYLMYLRLVHLLEQPNGEVGLRRAMHACALIEIVHNAYEDHRSGPRADKLFGFFKRGLAEQVLQRLIASRATLKSDELHFADINWWTNLDRERASHELEANLLRMISDEPTTCLMLGIELQVLFDINMRYRLGDEYLSFVGKYAAEFPILATSRDRFELMVNMTAVA